MKVQEDAMLATKRSAGVAPEVNLWITVGFFQTKGIFVQLDKLSQLNQVLHA